MNDSALIAQAADLLANSRRAVVLTGAGISTPSGIPDFRSPGSGLWQEVDPFEVASIHAFRRRPEDFYSWLRPVASLLVDAEPNDAHYALAQLEKHGPLLAVITQNIDGLHHKAGSRKVLELHGHMREMTCIRCYAVYPSGAYIDDFIMSGVIPYCERCQAVLKPNTILIGEQLSYDVMNRARRHVLECDLLLVAGSSLEIVPAGDLPRLAVGSGAKLIIVNFQPTHVDSLADVAIHADVVDILPSLAHACAPVESESPPSAK